MIGDGARRGRLVHEAVLERVDTHLATADRLEVRGGDLSWWVSRADAPDAPPGYGIPFTLGLGTWIPFCPDRVRVALEVREALETAARVASGYDRFDERPPTWPEPGAVARTRLRGPRVTCWYENAATRRRWPLEPVDVHAFPASARRSVDPATRPRREDGSAELPSLRESRRAAWDTWELVERHSREEITALYRAALRERGQTRPAGVVDLTVTRMVDGAGALGGRVLSGGDLTEITEQARAALRGRREIAREVRDTVAAGSAGSDRAQVADALAREYARRGVEDVDETALVVDALRIAPPGTVRERLTAVADVGRSTVGGIRRGREAARRHRADEPPEGAAGVPRGPVVAVRARLRDDAREVLTRLTRAADASARVWLTTTGAAAAPVVEVRIGPVVVGELDATASARWAPGVAAAAAAGAWVTAEALLTGTGAVGNPWLLRLLLARDPAS